MYTASLKTNELWGGRETDRERERERGEREGGGGQRERGSGSEREAAALILIFYARAGNLDFWVLEEKRMNKCIENFSTNEFSTSTDKDSVQQDLHISVEFNKASLPKIVNSWTVYTTVHMSRELSC